jgi:diguanylate cyclase (GGDEF)-like protein
MTRPGPFPGVPVGGEGRAVPLDWAVIGTLLLAFAAVAWFAFAPADTQRVVFLLMAPVFVALIVHGMWEVAADRGQPVPAVRYWRTLALAMTAFGVGMVVDLVMVLRGLEDRDIGETLFYPVGGVLAVAALAMFPTPQRSGPERLRMALDVTTVLLGTATFTWYFLVGDRWRPEDAWDQISDGLILPALTVVAGFAVLRISLAGSKVFRPATTALLVLGALGAAATTAVSPDMETTGGRIASMCYAVTFTVVVLAVRLQLRWRPDPSRPARSHLTRRGVRMLFAVLPYAAVVGTLVLLLLVLGPGLSEREWAVMAGVLALGVVVIVRQLSALWENARLLGANARLTGQLRHQAFHDPLTGLANRALFTERVTAALADARRTGATVAVLFVDLDDFKVINDSLGHHVGDAVLTAVADRLRAAVPETGLLGRLGGDEFAMLVIEPDSRMTKPETAARSVAGRIVSALADPVSVGGLPVTAMASVGIALAPRGEPPVADLLRNADVAMYSAKNHHKGGWRVFEPTMLDAMLTRHRLQAALTGAMAREEFQVHYQPIVDLVTGAVHGAEALVRWQRPDGTSVAPGDFIPLAEETGLVTEIDRWVLERACHQAALWWQATPDGRPFALHVNLSARYLHRADLVTDVARALRDSDLPPDRLTLEITESGLGHDHQAAIERLGELGRLGVHLAIDDFGTGYSSLAFLRRMPVNTLKIDKTFTAELAGRGGPAPLTQAVIALATTLGMDTVAEGIEEPVQAGRLRALGCRYGQGYLYAEPLSPEAMAEFLGHTVERQPAG